MKFHKDGTLPENGEIFVFGSNLVGAHGAGAARAAHQHFGAELGRGIGMTGQAYAIPTKDRNIQTLTLDEIYPFVRAFVGFAKNHPEMEFFVTGIGCGLAGYTPKQIAPMFNGASSNCSFPDTWKHAIEPTLRLVRFSEEAFVATERMAKEMDVSMEEAVRRGQILLDFWLSLSDDEKLAVYNDHNGKLEKITMTWWSGGNSER